MAGLDPAAGDDQAPARPCKMARRHAAGAAERARRARHVPYNKGGDSGYRLHGTPEWFSIGKAMSSGCIRLMNQDIIDLYNRASVGAKVIVK